MNEYYFSVTARRSLRGLRIETKLSFVMKVKATHADAAERAVAAELKDQYGNRWNIGVYQINKAIYERMNSEDKSDCWFLHEPEPRNNSKKWGSSQ